MPSAAFFAWASFILAWPLAAASFAISVAAVACALTLSSSPIGRLLSSRFFPRASSPPSWDPPVPLATGIEVPPQVGAAADPSVVDVVVVDALGSVLVGTEVVDVSPCDVVVVVLVDFAPLTGGTVVVVVVVAPATGAPST